MCKCYILMAMYPTLHHHYQTNQYRTRDHCTKGLSSSIAKLLRQLLQLNRTVVVRSPNRRLWNCIFTTFPSLVLKYIFWHLENLSLSERLIYIILSVNANIHHARIIHINVKAIGKFRTALVPMIPVMIECHKRLEDVICNITSSFIWWR